MCVDLEAVGLKAIVETLEPRAVGGVLRRTPIEASRKTTNRVFFEEQLVQFVF